MRSRLEAVQALVVEMLVRKGLQRPQELKLMVMKCLVYVGCGVIPQHVASNGLHLFLECYTPSHLPGLHFCLPIK